MTLQEMRQLAVDAKALAEKVKPGPYWVERVDFEDGITYEVAALGESFHVVFREGDFDKGNPKAQAELYARSNYLIPTLATALLRALEALEIAKKQRSESIKNIDRIPWGQGDVATQDEFIKDCDAVIDELLKGEGK